MRGSLWPQALWPPPGGRVSGSSREGGRSLGPSKGSAVCRHYAVITCSFSSKC